MEVYQNILKLKWLPPPVVLHEAFFLKKEDIWQPNSLIFCTISEERYFSPYILSTDHVSLPDCLYFLRYWKINMCIVITCLPVCDCINFEINLSFLIKLFFYMTKTSGQKFKYFENQKSF